MRPLIAITLSAALTGCVTSPSIPIEPRAIIKVERIVAPIPNALLDIPDPIPNLPKEVLMSDDKAVAKWLLDSEGRTLSLEAQIRQIRALYIQQLRDARAANVKEGLSKAAPAASAPQ